MRYEWPSQTPARSTEDNVLRIITNRCTHSDDIDVKFKQVGTWSVLAFWKGLPLIDA